MCVYELKTYTQHKIKCGCSNDKPIPKPQAMTYEQVSEVSKVGVSVDCLTSDESLVIRVTSGEYLSSIRVSQVIIWWYKMSYSWVHRALSVRYTVSSSSPSSSVYEQVIVWGNVIMILT